MTSSCSWLATTNPSSAGRPSMPPTDKEGYLVDLGDWSETVAEDLAAHAQVALTEAHWEVIRLVQAFYAKHDLSPAMRPLVKWAKQSLGVEKGTSIYLLGLFPGNPAKLSAKIAGLPRPTNCI